jgi:hypothetical protein
MLTVPYVFLNKSKFFKFSFQATSVKIFCQRFVALCQVGDSDYQAFGLLLMLILLLKFEFSPKPPLAQSTYVKAVNLSTI